MQYKVHEMEERNKIQVKLAVDNGKYTSYSYLDIKTLKKLEKQPLINPVLNKLFNQDIIEIDVSEVDDPLTMKVLHSSTRSMKYIPGVLVLEGNKTYGKINNKFYYKCIPDDIRLPMFLVPYKEKLTFGKKKFNKYVIFQFHSWINKHPEGRIMNNLGDVNGLESFYEYQLYCKSLYASIQQFQKITKKQLRRHSEEEYVNKLNSRFDFTDRSESYNVYSVDPETSKDFDDAFSIKEFDDYTLLSIYISNVSFWFEILNLWESFSERISTIYLPDRKRPMLPTVLSDAICSLTQKDNRFAFTLDIYVNKENEIIKYDFLNTMIKVRKNYRYDTNELENIEVLSVYNMTKKLNKNRKYRYVDSITSTHDMIAYLMILMNYYCAGKLKENETGIYRSAKLNNSYVPPETVPDDVKKFLKMWHSFGGKYTKYENIDSHEMLDLDAYVHITSPIRRLVDFLNILKIQDVLGLVKLEGKALEFYNSWTSDEKITYINTTMRSIRKVQNECSLLEMCKNNEEVTKKIYKGYVFDKIKRNDGLYQYMVYLKELKMTNRLTSRHNLDVNNLYYFKIYVFIDEARLKQKLRIELQK